MSAEIALTESELQHLADTWLDTGPTGDEGPAWASFMDAVFGALAEKRAKADQRRRVWDRLTGYR